MPWRGLLQIRKLQNLASVLFVVGLLSAAQEKPSGPSPIAAPAITAYPDKPAGLEQLAKDIVRTTKEGNAARLDALLASLVLPDPATWYAEVFGGSTGEELAQQYERDRADLPRQLGESFQRIIGEHVGGPEAHKYENSCDDNAGELVFPVLMARLKPVPLYEIRFSSGNQLFRLWAFAYVDGGFRYVKNLHPPGSFPPRKPGEEMQRIMLQKNLATAKLVHRVQPEYPQIARAEHLQGTVRLRALIGRDGLIRDLRVVSGYCSLADASLKAVRQWRYTPTLVNGEPVEVDTTIDVIFTLNR